MTSQISSSSRRVAVGLNDHESKRSKNKSASVSSKPSSHEFPNQPKRPQKPDKASMKGSSPSHKKPLYPSISEKQRQRNIDTLGFQDLHVKPTEHARESSSSRDQEPLPSDEEDPLATIQPAQHRPQPFVPTPATNAKPRAIPSHSDPSALTKVENWLVRSEASPWLPGASRSMSTSRSQ